MKRKWVLVLAFMLLAVPVFAAQLKQEVIATTTLSKPSPTTSAVTYTGDAKRVSFFVTYDSSEVTTGVTVTIRAQVSYDGTNWANMAWYDTDGGVTLQTSEILSSDGNYAMWMPSAPVPFMKITATMDNANMYGPTETGSVVVSVVKDE